MESKDFDVIVVGAGHAGVEAATASARCGAKTALITNKIDDLGALSCNPSIGGVGKGILVREIDALDGIMARATDLASINRRILNQSKGPAVWGPRHQVDRELYKSAILRLLNGYKNLEILYAHVFDIKILSDNTFETIGQCGEIFKSKSLIITAGTFLKGKIVRGEERITAGRIGDKSSESLGEKIRNMGLNIFRLKTGTPPRILKDSIDFSNMDIQESDTTSPAFSYLNKEINIKQLPCFITKTTIESHEVIKNNKEKIPTLNGDIKFKGPRYCPSIEDKIRRFGDKNGHQTFLEPEGLNSDLIYPSGLSTSMSIEMQEEFFHKIKGLENCKIAQYGYAIEYDFIDPTELDLTLECKKIPNLFFAGQIIGTTGYEEAGSLGIIAGINAAFKVQKKEKFIPERYNSYIGVMIDDLVMNGVDGEPYRMFTSRSEYRLSCRSDNADLRLTPLAIEMGFCENERIKKFNKKLSKIKELEILLNCEKKLSPNELKTIYSIEINQDGVRRNAIELLEKGFNFQKIKEIFNIPSFEKEIEEYFQIQAQYKVYLERQEKDIDMIKKEEDKKIPENFDFRSMKMLSTEVIEKLEKFKPKDIYQASRIPGITPVAINAILKEICS